MSQPGDRDKAVFRTGPDLYRVLFRCCTDGILLLESPSGTILEANVAAGLTCGRPSEQLEGMSLADLVEPADGPRVASALQSAHQSGGYLLDISVSLPGSAGGSRPVTIHLEATAGGLLALVHDITEQARMMESVRREKEVSRGVLESLNACVLGVDLKGRTTLMNRRFRDVAGVALGDVLGRDPIESVIVERDRPTARRALQQLLGGHVVEELDLGIASGGEERTFSFNGALLMDVGGSPRGALWVGLDVTSTRRTAERARRSEERTQRSLQQLKEFSTVSNMILQERELDRVCRMFVEAIADVSTFNRAILTLCDDEFRGYQWYFAGLSEEEIAVFHQNKLTSRERVTIFQERYRLGNSYHIPRDEGWNYEGVRSQKDTGGMVDWHPDDFLFIPLFGSNKKIVGIVSVDDPADGRRPTAESISPLELFANQVAHAIEEKKLAQEVEKSTRRYRTLVDTMNDGLFTVDLREKITFSNPALARLTGYREDEMIGQPLSFLLPAESGAEFRRRSRLHHGGAGARFEVRLVSRVGDPIPVLISANPYVQNNAMVGVFAIVSDLREQKRAEEERRRMHEEALETNVKLRDSMQQLQAAQEQLIQAEKLSALGEMISGVAHELNNPLTGVMGYAQLLVSMGATEEMKKNLERIQKEAVRCQKIVQNLLTFARKHHPERKLVDLNDVARSTLDLRAYNLRVDNIEVELDLDETLPPVMADAYQLQQVFVNIINNAHQAIVDAGRQGRLIIRTSRHDALNRIEFIDNGPGIPEDKMGKIFDPFFTTKEIGRGTGLGLSLSYGIVKEHEGQIMAKSEPGQGATFIVELPVCLDGGAPAVSEPRAVSPRRKAAAGGGNILVVDDEETILDLLVALLEGSGYQVETAGNGRQALEKIRSSDYDVVISDLKMPDMGGQKLYDAVAEIKPQLLRRMIFSTGDTVNPSTQAFFQRTGNLYLSKPFRLEDVEDLVGRILSHR